MTKKPEVKPEVGAEVETEKVLNGQVWNERKLNNGLIVLTRVS